MHREGHLIGNHTYNHVQLGQNFRDQSQEEILKTNNRIYEVTGSYPVYMRPPYGAWKKQTEFWVEMIPRILDHRHSGLENPKCTGCASKSP